MGLSARDCALERTPVRDADEVMAMVQVPAPRASEDVLAA